MTNINQTKEHYLLLDAMRGIAAILVVCYHIFEAFGTYPVNYQAFNHGYLAVDFFFLLSGFVMSYAYDSRWEKMSYLDFAKRRLIRLHPMLVLSIIWGVILFYGQGSETMKVSIVSYSALFIAFLMNIFLIPATPNVEVRGHGEMFPLNGPTWSLFFEYIANIFYMFILRRLPNIALLLIVILSAIGLSYWAIFNPSSMGTLGAGWSLAEYGFIGGMLRISFSFTLGILISLKFKPSRCTNLFPLMAIILILSLVMPRLGGEKAIYLNAIYELFVVIFIFPLLIYFTASSKIISEKANRVCKFLGDISYPLYIIHYPTIYLYFGYIQYTQKTFAETSYLALIVLVGNILASYALLKLFDEPIRKYFGSKI